MSTGRTGADDLLAAALAGGATLAAAAEAAGVSPRTARRRMDDPAFAAQVHALRGDLVARALGKLADTMSKAADTLTELLDSTNPHVRLGAARSVLELGVRLREQVELEQRLAELEAKAVAAPTPSWQAG